MTPGRFITFEGGEGSGKSTQIKLLSDAFTRAHLAHIHTREPGGTTGAESIRRILLETRDDPFDGVTEAVLFAAARVDHVRKKITPALARGEHVLCDRFVDSTRVYQGIAGELGIEFINMLHSVTIDNLTPDLTILLDIDAKEGLKRATSRVDNQTRFEEKDLHFHQRIRDGFLRIAAGEPNRFAVIDAAESTSAIHANVLKVLRERLSISL